MTNEIKEILEKFNKEVEKAELTRNPYSNEDKKFKHILVSLSEEHFNIFKDTLDYITNLQESHCEYKEKCNEYNVGCIKEILCNYQKTNNNLQQRIDKAVEYIENNELYYDKELGLVEMMGAKSNRIPVVKTYNLLDILRGDE